MADTHNPSSSHGTRQQYGGSGGTGVAETLRHTASNVGEAAGSVAHRVEDAASSVAQGVEHAWESASTGVRQGAEYVAERAGDFWGDATGLVRRYPVASLLIAFGLGYMTGCLFSVPVPRWSDDMARRMSRSSA